MKNSCPVDKLLLLLGKKWTPHILWHLYNEDKLRFGELNRKISDITVKMLSERLKELEQNKIIINEYYDTKVPQSYYYLTQKGKQISKAIHELNDIA